MFKRDQAKVVDLESMLKLMRYYSINVLVKR